LPLRTHTHVWHHQTSSSPSIDSTSTIWKRASRNSCKILVTIQRRIKSYGPFEPLLWPGATRARPPRVSIPHPLYGKGHPQTRKILIAIQRLDQKLLLVRTVTLAWRDQTSSSPSIDSTSTIWKRTSRNSCKIFIAIRQSDQKLWPVRTVTLAWRDQTSTSLSIDSTSTISKRASRNSCKI
jgi:hypothetical protein